MRNTILLILLISSMAAFGQNSYTDRDTFLIGKCATPDTLIKTTVITGKSSWASTKVTLTASTSSVTRLYKAPSTDPGTGGGGTTARGNLLFESTFEGVSIAGTADIATQIGQPWSNQQHIATWGVQPINIARTGTAAVKFELRPGDPPVSSSYRSEITGPNESATNFEHWYGASFYIVNVSGNDASVWQWHHNNSVSIPPLALVISGGAWQIVHTKEGQGINNLYSDAGSVVRNTWTDFVFHVKWSTGSDGLLEVWKNGAKVLTYSGPTGYSGGNYMKTGVYQWDGVSTTQMLYVDDVRIGSAAAKYSDVAP